MGGYTTYNEKRFWDTRNENNNNNSNMRNDKSMIMDISDFDNMTTIEKQDFLRRYCCRSPNRSNHAANKNNKRQQRDTHTKHKQTNEGTAENMKRSPPNHPKMERFHDALNGNLSQDETTDEEWTPRKHIPQQPPTSTVLENLKHLFKNDGQDGKDLKFIIIEDGKNSKRHERSFPCEDKSVQADWTMVVDMREANQSSSNVMNMHEEKKRSDIVRKSVSDSEDDDDKHKIIIRTQKAMEASKQREDNLIAHLRDYRGRMEQLHRKITLRDCNIERLEAEICRLKEVVVEYRGKEKEMQSLINDLQLNISDQEAQYDEDLTLCQLREAELKRTIEDLQVVNRHLKTENARLNIELMHRPNKRTQDGKHSSLEVSNEHAPIHNRQSRSFDALSSAATSPRDDPSPPSCQTSKPTDQKVFLNGRIIMSHSTNLQQVLRMHTNLLNVTKSKSETPEMIRSRSRTRDESAEHFFSDRENSNNKNNKIETTNQINNTIPKPSKQEGRTSPHRKKSCSPKVQRNNDLQSEQQHHHHHHQQQSQHLQQHPQHHHHHQLQQPSRQTKHINQSAKASPNIQTKLETRT